MEVVNTSSTIEPVNMYNNLTSFIMTPIAFIILLVVVIIFIIFSGSLGSGSSTNDTSNIFNISTSSSTSSSTGNSNKIVGIIIFIILLGLIIINALQYFFSINVVAYIKGLGTSNKSIDIVVDQSKSEIGASSEDPNIPKIRFKKQVFNIPGNYYNYENAKALCKAYNAELASYEQIEKAYNNGAEWCNYGWSAHQNALFPTQKKTYDNLQKIKGHENDCGRPGINGGYIANPNVLFGVNCYGYKPRITPQEDELMKIITPYPETMEDKIFQKRVDYWKEHLQQILLSPFNYNSWGEL